MDGTASFSSPLQDPLARRRFLLALAASLYLHLSVVGPLLPEGARTITPPKASTMIAARLAAPAAVASSEALAPEQKAPGAQERRDRTGSVSPQRDGRGAPQTLPAADMVYYPATELDVFPRPLAALELQRLESATGGTEAIRAVVKIDERGIVRDIELLQDSPTRGVQEQLRVILAAARFAPARKDGQPVRSRIVLDIRFGPAADY